jgi:hypothetical protein
MQKATLAIFAVSLALGASAWAGNKVDLPGPKAGSYATVPVTGDQVMSAARFAVDAQQRALSADGRAVKLGLVCVLAAEQQVVAGVNYRLELRVTQDGAETTAAVVVWWQAWRKPDPYQLTSWDWR